MALHQSVCRFGNAASQGDGAPYKEINWMLASTFRDYLKIRVGLQVPGRGQGESWIAVCAGTTAWDEHQV